MEIQKNTLLVSVCITSHQKATLDYIVEITQPQCSNTKIKSLKFHLVLSSKVR